MKRSRLLSLAVVAFVVAIGAAAAVAAVKNDDWATHQQAVLDDAAGQLGVSPSELEKALRSAELKQLDEAVKAGVITKEDADRLKKSLESGDLPLFGPPLGGHRGPRGFGPGGPGFHRFGPGPGHHFMHGLDAAADYLGLTEEQLRDKLNDGKSLADIAKATDGKSVQGLEDAIVADAKTKLDAAVKDQKLTQDEADEMLDRLKEHVDELVNAQFRLHFEDRDGGAPPAFPGLGGGPTDTVGPTI